MKPVSKDYNLEKWSDVFQIDDTSPSGVSWNMTGNGKIKGKPCGWLDKGRWKCEYDNKVVQLGRVVYYLHHGSINNMLVVDHIDGDATNNHPSNLRLIDKVYNSRNKKVPYNSRLGINGVHELHYFVATWVEDGVQKSRKFNVKDYDSREEALAAAKKLRGIKMEELNNEGGGYTDRHIRLTV